MGGSAGIGVDYVITMDSHTVVFVRLLTCLQGASTVLAKHESLFVDYLSLSSINSNNVELVSFLIYNISILLLNHY
jgi:hypothetical protein